VPLHSSLGDRARLCLKKKKKKRAVFLPSVSQSGRQTVSLFHLLGKCIVRFP
uniref:Uncharacterized protein n=1 Tax=Theropithecus gelada TaxID=9565 RepID=A0A8D2EPC5_THEGE